MGQAGVVTERSILAAAAIFCLLLAGCTHPEIDLRRTAQPAHQERCITGDVAHPPGKDGFGCATAANLNLMVAHPEDLQTPLELATPRGDAAIAPARRHRLDQVKPLPGMASAEPEEQ